VQRRVAVLVGAVHGRRIASKLALDGGQVVLAQRAPQGACRERQVLLRLDCLVDERHDFAEPADGGNVHGSQGNATELLHDGVRIGAVLQQKLHDAGVAFANGVVQRRERSRENLSRQRRRLAEQLAHRRFIAAGAGGNHVGAVGVRVGHGCGRVKLKGVSCRTMLEENLFDICKFEFPCPGQGCGPRYVVGQVGRGAALEQELDHRPPALRMIRVSSARNARLHSIQRHALEKPHDTARPT
jgi:hypothetical protein